jgi:enoyl-CoA hydratase
VTKGQIRYEEHDGTVRLTLDRPEARNAFTFPMYEQLRDHCARIAEERTARVVVLRGAGGKAFAAGTDISQFQAFGSGDDGVEYEKFTDSVIEQLEALPMPTIAVIDGFAVGGGLSVATACDLRLTTTEGRFGVPVARTLGNCPAMGFLTRLATLIGPARTKEMLFTSRLWTAQEALAAGLVTEVLAPDALDLRVTELCADLAQRAPLTLAATKEAMRRFTYAQRMEGADLLRGVYGSADFREGVTAFVSRRPPVWQGR